MVGRFVFKLGAFVFNKIGQLRITCTCHSYSRWQHPGSLKTRTNVFEIDLIQIPILSLEKVCTVLIATITFCSLKLFFHFSGGSLKVKSGTLNFL